MTNGEALDALNVAYAIPLDLRPTASYTPRLILLRSDLARISRELDQQRQSIIADAMEAAGAPTDFRERLAASHAKGDDDPELARMVASIDTHFGPAWAEVAKEEAPLRRHLLTADQFDEIYAALTSSDAPACFKVGDREDAPAPILLSWIADLLIAPEL
ncbi:MAG: hypothetical protein NC117_09980 [Pseudoflavonifractor sp.]|nr:hypothetical protein [Pseudoflavonifractor sp.]